MYILPLVKMVKIKKIKIKSETMCKKQKLCFSEEL